MSSSPVFASNQVVLNAVSMTTNVTSSVIDISNYPGFCIHVIWTGTPTGSLNILASNDGVNFVSQDTTAIAGAAGQRLLNVPAAHYRYVQITYTVTSSTGAISAYLSAKQN